MFSRHLILNLLKLHEKILSLDFCITLLKNNLVAPATDSLFKFKPLNNPIWLNTFSLTEKWNGYGGSMHFLKQPNVWGVFYCQLNSPHPDEVVGMFLLLHVCDLKICIRNHSLQPICIRNHSQNNVKYKRQGSVSKLAPGPVVGKTGQL